MAGRDVITEATLRFVQEGAEDVERDMERLGDRTRATGAQAQSTADDFDTWIGKLGALSREIDENLEEKYQSLFLATDRINSITGAATGAFELAGLAVEGLSWLYEQATGAQERAAKQAALYNRQLEIQKQRADEAASALQGLSSATQGDALDVRVTQTIAWVKATKDLADAQNEYNRAIGDRAAVDRPEANTVVGRRLAEAGVRFVSDLEQAQKKVDLMTIRWNQLDERSRRAMTGALNSAVAQRDALLGQRDALDDNIAKAQERMEAARETLHRIKESAREERDLADVANEVVLSQIEQENAQNKVTAAIRGSTAAAEDFRAQMDVIFSTGPLARLLSDQPGERIEGVIARQAREDAEVFQAALQDMLDTEAFVAEQMGDDWAELARDMDKNIAAIEKASKRADQAFEDFYKGVGAGAAAALVDLAFFEGSLEEKFNALLRTVSREASIEALMSLGRGFRDLALGLPTAGVHFTSAGYFGAVGIAAGVGAAVTGGLSDSGPSSPTATAPSSTTSPGAFSRQSSGSSEELPPTVINANLVAGRRPVLRRERRQWRAEVDRLRGAA